MLRLLQRILRAAAALSLVNGALGLAGSVSLAAISPANAWEITVGLSISSALFAVGGLLLLTSTWVTPPDELVAARQAFVWWLVVAGWMVVPTGLLLGPGGGFHHQYGFGPFPFCYMILNGEDPTPGSLQFPPGYEVLFSPVVFVVLTVVWLAVLSVVVRMVDPERTRLTAS